MSEYDGAVSIRRATVRDYPAFVRLFPELATGDDVSSKEVWSEEIMPRTLLFERGGEVAGYVYVQTLDGVGYVRHVVVGPRYRKLGIGRALMREVAARLRRIGVEQWCLNVKPGNVAAVRLYEKMGMSLQHASVAMRMQWDIIDRLPEPGASLWVGPLLPGDDAAAQRELALPEGLLAQQRPRTGAHLLLARDSEMPVGAAVFRPEFPGAYPFRARTAAVARALLEHMRPNADRSKAFMQLVLEDSADLARALERAGAVRHLEFVHFRGPVPQA